MGGYAVHAQKQKDLDIYGLGHGRERFFALILTSKLDWFDKKNKEGIKENSSRRDPQKFHEIISANLLLA